MIRYKHYTTKQTYEAKVVLQVKFISLKAFFERTQINKIMNERGDIITDTKDKQRVIDTATNNNMPTKWTA